MTLDELIEKAIKALKESPYDFNEIELAVDNIKVHLVRTTPQPFFSAPMYLPNWENSWRLSY